MPKSKHRKDHKKKSKARSKKIKELQDKQIRQIQKLIENSKKKEVPEPNTLIGPQIILE